MKQIGIAIAVLIVGYLGFKGLSSLKKEQPHRALPPVIKTIEAKVVSLQTLRPGITALGRIQSDHEISLSAEVSGKAMPTEKVFKTGVSFTKGEVLIIVNKDQARLALNSSMSDLLNALAKTIPEIKVDFPDHYDKWDEFFRNISFDKKLPSLPETNDEKEKLTVSRLNIFKLYFAARQAELTLEKHTIRAPFNGTVTAASIQPGTIVRPGLVLGTIVRTDRMEIEVSVPTADLVWIKKGSKASITIVETGEQAVGTISRIGKAISREDQTVAMYVSLNANRYKNIIDGMYAQVSIQGKPIKQAYELPREAVFNVNHIYLVKDAKLTSAQVGIARLGSNYRRP